MSEHNPGSAPKNIFQRIIDREIPANIVHEDEHCLAFHDIQPQAPVHVLLIPKAPIASWNDLIAEHQELMGHLCLVLRTLVATLDLERAGYRVVMNCGEHGGQAVPHLHLHLLGGRSLSWPPG